MTTISLILKGKPYVITNLRSLIKLKGGLYDTLVLNHQYQVRSNVSHNVFQSFVDYLVDDIIPDVQIDNFHEYVLLNDEFKILNEILEEKQEDFGNEINFVNLILKDQSNPYYEKCISQNLDYYLLQHEKEMSCLSSKSLYNIFNHAERNLENHEEAYHFIKKISSNNSDNLVLLTKLDGQKMSIDSQKECILNSEINHGYLPKMGYIFDLISSQKSEIMSLEHQQIHNKIQIFIKYYKQVIPFDTEPSEFIYSILNKLSEKIQVPRTATLDLIYAGIELFDDTTLGSYSIPDKAAIYAIDLSEGQILIFVNTPHLSYIPLTVNPRCTVHQIKTMLDSNYDIKIKDQKLFFNNQELDDKKEICDYKIVSHSYIQLISSQNFELNIIVRIDLNRFKTVETNLNEKIKDIKLKIQQDDEYNRFHNIALVFHGQQLEDEKTVQYYHITDNSLILLERSASEDATIDVITSENKRFMIDTKLSEKFSEVKKEIEKMEKIPVDYQRLFCNGREINDDETVQIIDCLLNSCTFDLLYTAKDSKIIYVTKEAKNLIPFEVDLNGRIFDLKLKIQKRLRIPVIDQKLFYYSEDQEEEEEFENDKTFQHYKIPLDQRIELTVSYNRNLPVYVRGVEFGPTLYYVSPYDSGNDILKMISFDQNGNYSFLVKSKLITFDNEEQLRDYNIEANATIAVVRNLRG